MSDIVERLRQAELWSKHTRDGVISDGAPYEAADLIERQREALRQAREWLVGEGELPTEYRKRQRKVIAAIDAVLGKEAGE